MMDARPANICRDIIDHPAAWTGRSLGGKEGIAFQLSERHLAALDEVLARTRHLPPQGPTRRDFSHPVVDPLLAELRALVMHGRGVVLVQGLTRDRYSEEEFERIYWGFGTHWGTAAVQSSKGDRLGHVRHVPDNPHQRGYQSFAELPYHTDAYEMVGLMCVQRAQAGGESHIVSILAIHNEMLRTRPDLLEPLYRGFPTAVTEAKGTRYAVTPYNVPVFSYTGGQVSCLYSRTFMRGAARELGTEVPADLDEACDYFDKLSRDPNIKLTFMLEPGEMLIWNNFTNLHSRNEFKDSEAHKRHLLRLWLHVEEGRTVVPEILTWGRIYDDLVKQRANYVAVG